MADELDLENPPEDESPSARRRRARRAERGTSTDSKGHTGPDDGVVTSKLNSAFGKLADQLASKGDDELATAINEESSGMTQGLVSLTKSVVFLRGPLVFIIELALVLLAFWRVGRILFIRALVRRETIMAQRAQYEEAPPQPVTEFPEGAVIQ